MPEARRIRPEELAKLVAKAVDVASLKHKLEVQPHPVQPDFGRIPWWIVGRIIRDRGVDLTAAHKLSESITTSVNGKGDAFQPATMRIGNDILVGFIERFGNQIEVPEILGGGHGPSQF